MADNNINFDNNWGSVGNNSWNKPAQNNPLNAWENSGLVDLGFSNNFGSTMDYGTNLDSALSLDNMGFQSGMGGSNTSGAFGYQPEALSLDFGANMGGAQDQVGGLLESLGGWGGVLKGGGSVANIASGLAGIGLGASKLKQGKKMQDFYRQNTQEQMAMQKALVNREIDKDNYNRRAMGGFENLKKTEFLK